MQILQDLKDYLNQVNQESLKEEKDHLEHEINYFIRKIQILKEQILKSNSLEPLSQENLDIEFQELVNQVRNLISINLKLSNLQDEVIACELLTNQRQAQIFEILIFIENLVSEQIENYQDFSFQEDVTNYTDFINQFDGYLKSQVSSKLYEKIQGRIATMHRKASQFTKANQKLQIAQTNLDQFQEQISQLEILIEIKTPTELSANCDTPLPKGIPENITPILHEIHQENLEQLKHQQAQEIKKRTEEFTRKLQIARKRLNLMVLLSAVPLAFVFLFQQLEVESQGIPNSQNTNERQDNRPRLPRLNNQNDRNSIFISREELDRRIQEGRQRKLEQSRSMQQLQASQEEFQTFKSQLEASNLLKFSDSSKIHLYSYEGENVIHYLFYTSIDQHYAFDDTQENIANITHSINTIYGQHSSVTLHTFAFSPTHQLKFSSLVRDLY